MARPPKQTQRSHKIGVRVDAAELAAITAKAGTLPLAEFVRQAALNRKLAKTEPLPFDYLNTLMQIGADLNRLVRLAELGALDKEKATALLAAIDKVLAPVQDAATD